MTETRRVQTSMLDIAHEHGGSTDAAKLAGQPKIHVPTIVIHGVADEVNPPQKSATHDKYFPAGYERWLLDGIGHNPPQESPRAFADAILKLCARSS